MRELHDPLISQDSLISDETQLEVIRELMLSSSRTGAWLTLAEIAERTQVGEASISAQLRHLRKVRHGRYRVEKRRRAAPETSAPQNAESTATFGLWEYHVLPPDSIGNPENNGPADGESEFSGARAGDESTWLLVGNHHA